MASAHKQHMDAALHVLRYLKSNPNQGIVINSEFLFQLQPIVIQIMLHALKLENKRMVFILCQVTH